MAEEEVKVPEIRGPFRDAKELNEALHKARNAGCVVLSPLFWVDRILPHHAVALRIVRLDAADPMNSDDVWVLNADEEGGGGRKQVQITNATEVILTKVAMDKLSAAGGLDWVPELCGPIDDRSDPHYVHYRMVGELQDFDGAWRRVTGDRELDYRDGSQTIKGWRDARLKRARTSIMALAQSFAANNAVRRAFSMPSSFTLEQARRVFIVPKLVVSSEERWVQERIVERSLSARGALYGVRRPGVPGERAERRPPPLEEAPREAAPANGTAKPELKGEDAIPPPY